MQNKLFFQCSNRLLRGFVIQYPDLAKVYNLNGDNFTQGIQRSRDLPDDVIVTDDVTGIRIVIITDDVISDATDDLTGIRIVIVIITDDVISDVTDDVTGIVIVIITDDVISDVTDDLTGIRIVIVIITDDVISDVTDDVTGIRIVIVIITDDVISDVTDDVTGIRIVIVIITMTYEKAVEVLEVFYAPKLKKIAESFKFFTIAEEDESDQQFIVELRYLADKGNFGDRLPDSAAAGDEALAGDDDPAVAEIRAPLGRLWESMGKDQLVPSGVDLAIFLATEDDVVATEDLTDEALANCGPVNAEADSESDDSDDDSAKKSVSPGTTLAAVETLRDWCRAGRTWTKPFPALRRNRAGDREDVPYAGLGKTKTEYRMVLKDDAQPVVIPARRVPHALRGPFKAELDRMVAGDIIAKVQEPTDWMSEFHDELLIRLILLNCQLEAFSYLFQFRKKYPLTTEGEMLAALAQPDERAQKWAIQYAADTLGEQGLDGGQPHMH
ncbi:hypothetical protein ISCGN_007644 [Ixodes scapularis]